MNGYSQPRVGSNGVSISGVGGGGGNSSGGVITGISIISNKENI